MTLVRLWTHISLSRPGVHFNKTFLRYPVAISASLFSLKTVVADALVQIADMKTAIMWENWDYPRSLAFAMFGLYCGAVFGTFYSKYYTIILERMLRCNIPKILAVVGIGLFDSTVLAVTMYYPVYYTIQEFSHTHRFVPLKGLKVARENTMEDVKAMVSFFCPLTMINMLLVPAHLRAICVNIVGNIWCIILSKMRGKYVE